MEWVPLPSFEYPEIRVRNKDHAKGFDNKELRLSLGKLENAPAHRQWYMEWEVKWENESFKGATSWTNAQLNLNYNKTIMFQNDISKKFSDNCVIKLMLHKKRWALFERVTNTETIP